MKSPESLLFDFILFGASGDLALRKLLPALYRRHTDTGFHESTRIIGVARSPLPREAYQQLVKDSLQQFLREGEWQNDAWQAFASKLHFVSIDAHTIDGYQELKALVDTGEAPDSRPRVIYLSTPSSLYGSICNHLNEANLINERTRLVLEKPVGRNLDSAIAINAAVAQHFSEQQTYRIDHYLGKETVQNLLVLRFANPLFESLWNHHFIDHIQITIAESLGVEGRINFYEETGALRDIVQNHLLQLLCIVAMEPPPNIDPDRIRDEKLKVLRSLRPIYTSTLAKNVVRGQYRAGIIDNNAVCGYLEEEGMGTSSNTETYVALKVMIDNIRWAGIPFYLRTGKRLPERLCQIVVQFKEISHSIFQTSTQPVLSNKLVINLQPDESITLRLCGKRFGPGMEIRPMDLNLNPGVRSNKRPADAYERLLVDVINGDQTLFLRQDELEQAWRWVEPILSEWEKSNSPPDDYAAGSWGPSAATLLLAKDGKLWHEGT